MAKLILDRAQGIDGDLNPQRKLTYETRINSEVLLNLILPGVNNDYALLDLIIGDFRKHVESLVANFKGNRNKTIIIETNSTLRSTPVITVEGAALSFSVDETQTITIKGPTDEEDNC